MPGFVFAGPAALAASARPTRLAGRVCGAGGSPAARRAAPRPAAFAGPPGTRRRFLAAAGSAAFGFVLGETVPAMPAAAIPRPAERREPMKVDRTLYDFTVRDIDGRSVDLSKFRGKVVLVVNVASE
eukprot:tig00000178_g12727.t1